jgi:hypothetical protein
MLLDWVFTPNEGDAQDETDRERKRREKAEKKAERPKFMKVR